MTIKITACQDEQLDNFLSLSDNIYNNDQHCCVPFRDSLKASIRCRIFDGRRKILLASENGKLKAGLTALKSPHLTDKQGRPYGMIGFFESVNEQPVASALLNKAINWLKAQGCANIIGPINGDTWHRYRFSIGPFERPPFLLEPYNPEYYPKLWEDCGFRVIASFHSKYIDELPPVIEQLEKYDRRARANGYIIRTFKTADFEEELRLIHRLSCSIFADNYLYTPIEQQEFMAMYAGTKSLLDPDLIFFAIDNKGDYAGYLFCLPDYAEAVRAMRGKTDAAAKLRFLLKRHQTNSVNIKTLGIMRRHRGRGLSAALVYNAYRTSFQKGFRTANICLVMDGNSSGRLDAGRGKLLRNYHFYQYRER